MLDRLNFIENKYDELSVKISDPSVMAELIQQRVQPELQRFRSDMEMVIQEAFRIRDLY